MKLTVDAGLERVAEDFSAAVMEKAYSFHNHGSDNGEEQLTPEGWTQTAELHNAFASDAATLEAFTVATKHLANSKFGKDLLEEWRDERSYYKEEDPSLTMADFMEEHFGSYLENFTGRNLTQLVKYYLSPRAIEDAAWNHFATWTSDDGLYTAYSFCPLPFREHDGILWLHENATGKGFAIPHDEL